MGGAQRRGRGQDKDKEKEDKTKAIRERARKRVRELSNLTEDEKEEKKMARKLEIAGAVQKDGNLPSARHAGPYIPDQSQIRKRCQSFPHLERQGNKPPKQKRKKQPSL